MNRYGSGAGSPLPPQHPADGNTAQPYVVDPHPHTDSKLHVRMGTAALAELPPSWYIGVTQMNKHCREVSDASGLLG